MFTAAKGWLIELVIVFMGVFAAFQLSEYKAERRKQIKQAVIQEIEGITARTRKASENVSNTIMQYDSLIAAGKMPGLFPLIEPIRVNNHMWQATLQSGGLDLLDVQTMVRISEFYNALNAGFAQLAQLRDLSENLLIPNIDKETTEFYDPETRALRQKYQWYIAGLKRTARLAKEITRLGDSLVVDLKE